MRSKYPMFGLKPKVPPIKSQGIKTKLVPFILSSFKWDGSGRWIEPFLGSGVVMFNAAPEQAIAADQNKHIIHIYQKIQSGDITGSIVKDFLEEEGASLLKKGEDHYYEIRERFNNYGDSLDFIFLNRSCFNGMIRFNSKGNFNVPFCRKPDRFRPAYITKICNQVLWLEKLIKNRDWKFLVQDWKTTLDSVLPNDFVYLDPPYIGRHAGYFNSWVDNDADELALTLKSLPCGFAYSMWLRNQYRENEHLLKWFKEYPIVTKSHFYHVGPTENLRNPMEEALVVNPTNFVPEAPAKEKEVKTLKQAALF